MRKTCDNTGMNASRAYLSIVRWPDGPDEDRRADMLARVTGLDAYTARAVARRPTPCVAMRCEPSFAEDATRALHQEGVHAANISGESIARGLEPLALKTLHPAMGAPEPLYGAEPWDGETVGFKAADVRLLVRGQTRVTSRKDAGPAPLAQLLRTPVEPIAGIPLDLSGPMRITRVRTTEVLDVCLFDGARFRCDASRFSFQFLGDEFGLSDTENLDRVTTRLARESPRAAVDTNFKECRFLSEIVGDFMTLRAARGGTDRHGMLAFSIYSAWLAEIDRWERAGLGRRPRD